MPRGDRTGPLGQGPGTGRGAGYCGGSADPGFANPAAGRGLGNGRLTGSLGSAPRREEAARGRGTYGTGYGPILSWLLGLIGGGSDRAGGRGRGQGGGRGRRWW
jgi:hypothetical protein